MKIPIKAGLHVLVFMLSTLSVFAQNVIPPGGGGQNYGFVCCENNLIKNGEFIGDCSVNFISNMDNTCLPNWAPDASSPQQVPGMGFSSPGYVGMWGNDTYGESIKQSVNFVAGKRYRISVAVRCGRPNNAQGTEGLIIRFTASGAGTPAVMWNTPATVSSMGWVYLVLPEWVCPANYNTLTIGALSGTRGKFAYGNIDDVCIVELPPCEKALASAMSGPTFICEGSPASYSVPNVPGATYAWTITPAVLFSGNGSNTINITGPNTMGKTNFTVTVKISCGGKDYFKTLNVVVRKRISSADFTLSATQGPGTGYSCSATPLVGAGYNHIWILYQSDRPFPRCTASGSGITAVNISTSVNYSRSGLIAGKYYLLRHGVQNCDGTWLYQNRCFNLLPARIREGAQAIQAQSQASEVQTLKNEDTETELILLELTGKKELFRSEN